MLVRFKVVAIRKSPGVSVGFVPDKLYANVPCLGNKSKIWSCGRGEDEGEGCQAGWQHIVLNRRILSHTALTHSHRQKKWHTEYSLFHLLL